MWPWDPSPLICHDVPLGTASQQGVVPLFLPMYLSLDSHDHGKGRWADFIFSLSEGPLWVPLQGSLRYQWNVSVWTSPIPTWVRTSHRADLSCLRSILFYFHYVAFSCPRKKKKKAQSCLTLCDPMDYSLSASSIHEIFHARILGWVAISFSKGSSQPRDWTWVSHIAGRLFTIWATREVPPLTS